MNETRETAGNWGIVELMGHKVVAGYVQKDEMLGKPMLRVDVPATKRYPQFTQFYGEAAIYCVTFVSEEVAVRAAQETAVNPVAVYVPDLVTREKFEEMQTRYQAEIDRLARRQALLVAEPERPDVDSSGEQDVEDEEADADFDDPSDGERCPPGEIP